MIPVVQGQRYRIPHARPRSYDPGGTNRTRKIIVPFDVPVISLVELKPFTVGGQQERATLPQAGCLD